MRVTFPSADLTLEGELTLPAAATRSAVICHPHPQYGGDMHNPVVRTVEGALQRSGFATLRFNYRGVGQSQGAFAGGVGEQDDVRAAVAYLQERSGTGHVTLAGYSFGAMVALQVGTRLSAADRLIAVAPPLTLFNLSALSPCTTPTLFIAGDRDPYCDAVDLRQQRDGFTEPTTPLIVAGADHFLYGHESEIADAIVRWVAG